MSGRWQHTESRQQRGYGAEWQRIREAILERDMMLCQVCLDLGLLVPATEVDHIVPKHKGGNDTLTNLQAICSPCHKTKTTREAAEAQGRAVKDRPRFDHDGRVVW